MQVCQGCLRALRNTARHKLLTFCENAVGQDVSLLPVSLLSTDPCVDSAEGMHVVSAEVSFLCFQFVQDGQKHITCLKLKIKARKVHLTCSQDFKTLYFIL